MKRVLHHQMIKVKHSRSFCQPEICCLFVNIVLFADDVYITEC